MDNASIHKSEELQQMIEDQYVHKKSSFVDVLTKHASGMGLVFLPAYSPDLNPIEEAFSAIKAWIWKNRDYVIGELTGGEQGDPYKMIWDAVMFCSIPRTPI